MQIKSFASYEIALIALYLLGGETKVIDTEDIAFKINKLAPGRFTWLKYPDQINIENIRHLLQNAKEKKDGGFLIGSQRKGWLLNEQGVAFAKKYLKEIEGSDLSRAPLSKEEIRWNNREKIRMLSHAIMSKINAQGIDNITTQEAESFFRVDDYVTGAARQKKIARILNTFRDDPDIGQIVITLSERVPMK